MAIMVIITKTKMWVKEVHWNKINININNCIKIKYKKLLTYLISSTCQENISHFHLVKLKLK